MYSLPPANFSNSMAEQNSQATDDLQPVKRLILKDLRYMILESASATAKYLSERRKSTEQSATKSAQPLLKSLDNALCMTDCIERKLTIIREFNDAETRLKKARAVGKTEDPIQVQKNSNELRGLLSKSFSQLNNLRQSLRDREQKSAVNPETNIEVEEVQKEEFIDQKEEIVDLKEEVIDQKEGAVDENEEAIDPKEVALNRGKKKPTRGRRKSTRKRR